MPLRKTALLFVCFHGGASGQTRLPGVPRLLPEAEESARSALSIISRVEIQ